MKRLPDTAYLFLSGYLWSQSNHRLTGEQLAQMWKPSGKAALSQYLRQYPAEALQSSAALNEACEIRKRQALQILQQFSPSEEMLRVFRFPDDAHNLKAMLKTQWLEIPISPDLLSPDGNFPPEKLAEAIAHQPHTLLPNSLAEAVVKAGVLLQEDHDPQAADHMIDNACFRIMAETAAQSGSPVLQDYVCLTVDTANLLLCGRLQRYQPAMDIRPFEGGSVSAGESYRSGAWERAATLAFSGQPMLAAEYACQLAVISQLQAYSNGSFGDAVPVLYWATLQLELAAVRLAAMGLRTGQLASIQERLRGLYG